MFALLKWVVVLFVQPPNLHEFGTDMDEKSDGKLEIVHPPFGCTLVVHRVVTQSAIYQENPKHSY